MPATVRDRVSPYRLYTLGMVVPNSFLVAFVYTTAIVYYVRIGHLNPLQLILLGTVLELAYFILQLPTGVLADLVSRRLCVVAGWLFTGAGFALQGLSHDFGVLLAAQVVLGLGAALQEGAEDAWIADELDEDVMTHVYVRAAQLGIIATVGGAVLSGIVADQRAREHLPLLTGGLAICAVGLVLAVVMPERHARPAGDEAGAGADVRAGPGGPGVAARSWRAFTAQVRASKIAVVAVPGFVLLLAMTFFVGMWSESFDRLWGDFLIKAIGFPHLLGLRATTWFSVIAVAVALLSLGATEVARRRIGRLGHTAVFGTLLTVTVLVGAGVLVMSSAHLFAVAIVAYLFVQALRPVYYPLVSGWIVSRVEPRYRATALSGRDMFDSGGQILGGPVVGWIGVIGTVRTALYAGAAALAPAVLLLLAVTRRVRALPPEPRGAIDKPSDRQDAT